MEHAAGAAGPIAAGKFRAVVLEPDGRVGTKDFDAREAAMQYADDAAWETENGVVVAYVLDDAMQVVHQGRGP